MLPTLRPRDRVLAVSAGPIRRGDVWVVLHRNVAMVKRVVGLPGDRVLVNEGRARLADSDGVAARAGPQPDGSWVLASDEYLVQGDNREESTDVRAFGPVSPDDLIGRVVFRYWPRPGPVR
jgi:signal peptidase I